MSTPFYRLINGNFIIQNKSPDGDSVRFIADNPSDFDNLHRGYLMKISKDGSVQLRFEGIDAAEVHYAGKAQPLGNQSRDKLISLMGFENIKYNGDKVANSEPIKIAGSILTNSMDTYGRPIAYTLLQKDTQNLDSKGWVFVDEDLIKKTFNYQMLNLGEAYFLSYTSQQAEHRNVMRAGALNAREKNLGVWKVDTTTEFTLKDINSVTEGGQLIFPKLFRRTVDYFKSVQKGYKDCQFKIIFVTFWCIRQLHFLSQTK
jgi:endonuclease YncB( thermonuclease family)